MTRSDGWPNRSEVVAALRDLKGLVDARWSGDASRHCDSYLRASELLERFDAPKKDPVVALWLVKVDPAGVQLRRLGGDGSKLPLAGHVMESYTHLPTDRAAKALVQIARGTEPARHLFRSCAPDEASERSESGADLLAVMRKDNANLGLVGLEGKQRGETGLMEWLCCLKESEDGRLVMFELACALRDFKYLLDIQEPGSLRAPRAGDARESAIYRQSADVLAVFERFLERSKSSEASLMEWLHGLRGSECGRLVVFNLWNALFDFKYLLDIQEPGTLRAPRGGDARESAIYRKSADVLTAFELFLDPFERVLDRSEGG